MKRIFLLFAFTGIVGAASATSIATCTKGAEITLGVSEKKQEEKKKCDKEKKGCCKKDATKKACSEGKAEGKADVKDETKACQHGKGTGMKACCKDKAGVKKEEEKEKK